MTPRAIELLFAGWLWRLPGNSPRIALTFDDGPDPATTPALLKTLEQTGLKSTMFVNGANCVGQSELLREIAGAGHSVANHGYEHRNLFWSGPRAVRRSIERTREEISAAGVQPSIWFRPPHGAFNLWTLREVRRAGMSGAMWSTMLPDWRPGALPDLKARLARKLGPGTIVVLHDGHRDTASNVRGLIQYLAEHAEQHRLTIMPLTESLNIPPS
jgi:peptidoglycan-N-acetylglucosamine deacetylase